MIDRRWVYWLPKPIRDNLGGKISLQAILANSSWLIFDKIIRIFVGLFIGAWLARYLGPAQYGELAYALAYIAIFQSISTLGMDAIIVREISQNKTLAPQILGSCFVFRLISGTVCWLVAVVSMAYFNGWSDHSVWMIALIGGGLIFQAADTIDLWFQSQSESRNTVLAKLVAYTFSNGIKVLLILYQAPLVAFAAVVALDSLAVAISLIFVYLKYPRTAPWYFIQEKAKLLFKESWPLMLSSLSIVIYMRIDQIMIKEMLGEQELGIYAAMLPLSTIWNILPMAIIPSIAPFLSRKKELSNEDYYQTLFILFRISLLGSILISIFTIIFAAPLTNILYGKNYEAAADILKIHVISNIPVFLGVTQGLWIINEKKSHIALIKTVIGGLSSVALNFVLIPKVGLTGAAISAVISYFISAVFCNIFLARKIFFMQLGIRT